MIINVAVLLLIMEIIECKQSVRFAQNNHLTIKTLNKIRQTQNVCYENLFALRSF